jgi:hypothetical protein
MPVGNQLKNRGYFSLEHVFENALVHGYDCILDFVIFAMTFRSRASGASFSRSEAAVEVARMPPDGTHP